MKTLAEIEAALERLAVTELESLLHEFKLRLARAGLDDSAQITPPPADEPALRFHRLRRYLKHLEHRLAHETEWAVFEPNGEELWAQIRRRMEETLLKEWQSGALPGAKPEQAF